MNSEADLLGCFSEEHSQLVRLAHDIGIDNINKVLDVLGGQKPHIPMRQNFWGGLERQRRDTAIYNEFTGNNYQELAIRYQMGERQLRNILSVQGNRINKAARKPEDGHPVKVSGYHHDRIALLASQYGVSMHTMTDLLLDVLPDGEELHQYLRDKTGMLPLDMTA